jgi:hypothetical protein
MRPWKHTKTDALISDKGNGVYRHRFCFRSSSEASEFVWILWLVDALVDALVDGLVEAGVVAAACDGLQEDIGGDWKGSGGSRTCSAAESVVMGNWSGIETRDYSRGLIPRKIDLLRRGDVPLRGGVFGVQKTPSHKP